MSDLKSRIGLGFQASMPIQNYSRIAGEADRLGFGWIHIYDDLAYRPGWPILFSVAANTKRVYLGPAVTHPFYRHPLVTAANIACLDELTGGRAILGIGRGGLYECYGIDASGYISVLREAIQVICHILSREKAPYSGKHFTVEPCGIPRYAPTRSKVPIFLGTWGPKTSQLAGELREVTGIKADSLWNPAYIDVLKENVAIGARKSGRDPSEVSIEAGALTYVSSNLMEAKKKLKRCLAEDYIPALGNMLTYAGISRDEVERVTHFASRGRYEEGAKYVSDLSLEKFTAYGTPDEIISQAERMFRSGVARVSFNHPHGASAHEALEEIGTKILPYFNPENGRTG